MEKDNPNAAVPLGRIVPERIEAPPPSDTPVSKPEVSSNREPLTGLRLTKRSAEIDSLEEFYFFLTNDTRTLIEFDRSFLLVHLGGESFFAASNNQPSVEKKSTFTAEWNKLADLLKDRDKVIFLSSDKAEEQAENLDMPVEILEGVKSYLRFSECKYLFCIPLLHDKRPIGHVVFEFIDAPKPDKSVVEIMLTIAPSLASDLVKVWVRKAKPAIWSGVVDGLEGTAAHIGGVSLKAIVLIVAAIAISIGLFLVPVTFTVGGEAEIVPKEKYKAFSRLDGVISEVLVKEGDMVQKGQPLATLDPRDIKFEIMKAEREGEILLQEIRTCAAGATEDPSILAKKTLAELKKKQMDERCQYLKWKSGFLKVCAPVNGIILTKEIESLRGKGLRKGEPFCEIAKRDEAWVVVRVPEERIGYVRAGQTIRLFLNAEPSTKITMKVRKISPIADVLPRLGNVFRVRAPFPPERKNAKLGMKGIGRIDTLETTVWFVLTERLKTRWNQFMLNF